MEKEPIVKYQYADTEQHYGNDCTILRVVTVLEVDCVYIATRTVVYRGWMGTKSDTESKVFTSSYADAVSWCEEFMGDKYI